MIYPYDHRAKLIHHEINENKYLFDEKLSEAIEGKVPAGAQAPDPDAREAANQTQPPENNRQPRAGPQESREARANELFRLFGSQCLKWNCPRRVPRGPAAPS